MITRRGIERSAAAGIIVLAAVLAWVIVDRPVDTPPPAPTVVAKPPPAHEKKPAETAAVALAAAALSIELVELSEPPPTTIESTATPPVPAPRPTPQPVRQEAAEAPAPPPPVPVDTPVTPRPEPVVAAPAPPPLPSPRLSPPIIPLRPTPRAPEPEMRPAVLEPELTQQQQQTDVVPLRPEPPRVKPAAPTPMPVVERPAPARPPQPDVTPMRPTPLPQRAPAPETKVVMRTPTPPAAPPKPAPEKPAAKAEPPQNVAAVVGEGRAYLKILEQGAGPSIEIRWPSDPGQRDRLYDVLVQCLGMRTGLLDGDGRLFLGEGQKGQPSTLDGERYSGFVRRPEGAIARDEEREIGRVRGYHQVRASASAARIFPRRVDAYLIGGLRNAVGENYLKIKSIRASYRLSNGRAVVESIMADGRRLDGAIDLSAVASSCSY